MHKILKHENLYERIIQNPAFNVQSPCGGNHVCGKCRVRILEGNLPITALERKHIQDEDLQKGIRLACEHTDCEEECLIASAMETSSYSICTLNEISFPAMDEDGYAIALDIGTTTVAGVLLGLKDGSVIDKFAFLNPQSVYGSDVITRIASCNSYGVSVLQKCLLTELEKQLLRFDNYEIKRMVVCGNPTMMHIFAGVDPYSLGVAPYTCTLKKYQEILSTSLFNKLQHSFIIQLLPPISAYVGSDIVMGVYSTRLWEQDGISAFLDLGTNGEMALYKDRRFYVTSAACGPAFEGGNTSCGIGAVDGAICNSRYNGRWHYETLENGDVSGICGSGFLSILHEALKHNLVEDNGYLGETLMIHPYARVEQKDVREFQLAKSAIASAFLCMCQHADITTHDIKRLYIAGGFGKYANTNDLVMLGLLPHSLKDRLETIGNSALRGSCIYALQQDDIVMHDIIHQTESLLLANDPMFSDLFMKHMMFETYES